MPMVIRVTDTQRKRKLALVEGMPHQKAADRLGISVFTVRTWRRKFRMDPPEPFTLEDEEGNVVPPTPRRRVRTTPTQAEVVEAAPPDPPDPEMAEITEPLAEVYAQLLHAGCPALQATMYTIPSLSAEECKALTKLWLASPVLRGAVERLQGGAWVKLPPEKRYELALAKHLSEAAFFLHANNFNEAANRDALEMFKQARELLKAELKGNVDELDPMQAFARFALEMVKGKMVEQSANSRQPIDLQPSGMDRIHEEMTKVPLPRSGEKLN